MKFWFHWNPRGRELLRLYPTAVAWISSGIAPRSENRCKFKCYLGVEV